MATSPMTTLDKMAADFLLVSDTYTGTSPANPYPQLAELREKNPVMPGDILARYGVPSQADYANSGRKVFTVFHYDDVIKVLRDPVNWRSSLNADGFGAAVDNLLITGMDGDEHKAMRNLLSPTFAMQVIQRLNDTLVRPVIRNEFIDKLRPNGRADLVREFGLPFPVRVVYAIFGFPDNPAAVMQFAGWALAILAGPQVDPEMAKVTGPAAMDAARKLFEHVLPIIQQRRAEQPRDDLIGFLLTVDKDGEKFTDAEIATFVRMLLLAASETTSRTFANMMVLLFEHPGVLERLRADRSLIGKAITETMRLEPVAAYLARLAARDMEIGGVTIPAGTAVSLCIAAANRDPKNYERPDELDIDRPMRPVLSFGFGPHMCMGMHIARLEIEAAVDALLDLPNLRLDPAYPKPVIRGMQMRGPDSLHVLWDA